MTKEIISGLILTTLVLLSGCWSIRVPIDTPPAFSLSKNSLNSLIGSNSSDVINTLGQPTWIVQHSDIATHYVYQWWSKDYEWLWVGPVPGPVDSFGEQQPHCILLEFENDQFESYKVETSHSPDNCLVVFYKSPDQALSWAGWEASHPEMYSDKSDSGDVESQFKLYLFEKGNPENVKMLCNLADIGHTKAQKEIARLYWHRNDIENNRSKSHMWYTLAATTNFSERNYYDESTQKSAMEEVEYKLQSILTEEELAMALKLLSQWYPGQCASDFVTVESGN